MHFKRVFFRSSVGISLCPLSKPFMTTAPIEKSNKEGDLFLRLNRKTKQGEYTILPKSSQHKFCESVTLEGFDRLPGGFYTNDGIGLTGAGFYLFQELIRGHEGKKVALRLVARGKSSLDNRGPVIKATLLHGELSRINATVRAIKYARNEETRAQVRRFLATQFKRQFRHFSQAAPQYAAGSLAQALQHKDVISKLSVEDRLKLEEFIPEYLTSIKGTLKSKAKLQVLFDALDAGKKVYFEKIIKEFRKRLNSPSQGEHAWQEFLSEYILVLRSSYGTVLEKQSVTLKGKFPDFMLLDPYSYLDIYEIKKPTTNLLKHDSSRDNYYWDVELSKAISQVENYLHQVQRNSDGLVNDIRKSKGVEVSIVRPKGYIVAGTRTQLKNAKMIDDFRILSSSLKNLDVILYDDLLENLESFVKTIGAAIN